MCLRLARSTHTGRSCLGLYLPSGYMRSPHTEPLSASALKPRHQPIPVVFLQLLNHSSGGYGSHSDYASTLHLKGGQGNSFFTNFALQFAITLQFYTIYSTDSVKFLGFMRVSRALYGKTIYANYLELNRFTKANFTKIAFQNCNVARNHAGYQEMCIIQKYINYLNYLRKI